MKLNTDLKILHNGLLDMVTAAAMIILNIETATEIRAKMDKLLESNQHWKSCQDGSYEMALSMSGYYDLQAQLAQLLTEEK